MFKAVSDSMRQALPIPGLADLTHGLSKVCSTTDFSNKRADLLKHISIIQDELEKSNAKREETLSEQLNAASEELMETPHKNPLSRVLHAGDTLAALEELEDRVNKSVHQYSVAAVRDNSKAMEDFNTEVDVLRSETESLDERVSKNETEVSRLQGLVDSINGLYQKTSEALNGITLPMLSFWQEPITEPLEELAGKIGQPSLVELPKWRATIFDLPWDLPWGLPWDLRWDLPWDGVFYLKPRIFIINHLQHLSQCRCGYFCLSPTWSDTINLLSSRTQTILVAAEGFRAIASDMTHQPSCRSLLVGDPTDATLPKFAPSAT